MTLSRILMEETFDNGDGWNVNNTAVVTFTGGQGVIKGGGPNNRMGSKMKIPANDFLLEADLMIPFSAICRFKRRMGSSG